MCKISKKKSSSVAEVVPKSELKEEEVNVELNEADVSNFAMSDSIKEKLSARGIKKLFPIQYKTFNLILAGSDIVGQARTGTGKTFAFSLPVLTKLEGKKKALKTGRKPRVLVMAPTRELVNQIASEMTSVACENLSIMTVYGGVPKFQQVQKLRQGVDVVVGTPGRMKDLLEEKSLDLGRVKFVILDEVDRMLDMGFQDDVDGILQHVYGSAKSEKKRPQTLLFSATMPPWIENAVKKYLNPEAERVSLSDDGSQAASTVEHLALQCPWRERGSTISDVVRVYGGSGAQSRCIVFCERKKDADELAAHTAMPSDCHVLHGDVPQDKRELVLQKFREGRYTMLITTNVAARGIDIPDIDLVIQCHPPRDVEDYIHRSGRTGRAGRSGVSVCFYEPKEAQEMQKVERFAKMTFKRISAPSAAAILEANLSDTIVAFRAIPSSVVDMFTASASSLIEEFGAEKAVALALAKISGKIEEMKPRSALTAREGFSAYLLSCSAEGAIKFKGYVHATLKRQLAEETVEKASSVQFVEGRSGLVFDMPCECDAEVDSTWKDTAYCTLTRPTQMPELEQEAQRGGGGGFRGGFRGGRGAGRGGGGFKRSFPSGGDGYRGRGNNKMRRFD